MITGRPDNSFIPDVNKQRRTLKIRVRTAAQDATAIKQLSRVDWSTVYTPYNNNNNNNSCEFVQLAFDAFYNNLNSILDSNYPLRQVTTTSRDPPFMTPNIKHFRRRNRLMRAGRVEEASSLSSKVGHAIARSNARRLADIDFGGEGEGGAAISAMWKRVREVAGGSGTFSTDPPTGISATTLNQHYASVSRDPKYTQPLRVHTCTPPPSTLRWPSPWSVYSLLMASRSNAMGADGIPPWFSRLAAPFISEPLACLYNLSVAHSTVPMQWKSAIITPIPKTSSPSLSADFRPISVLPLFSTILEKLIIKHFLYPLLRCPPLSSTLSDQFAFRPTGSTTAAITSLIHNITSCLAKEPFVHVISLDFSKAFDVSRHSSLFERLRSLPLPDHIYSWCLSFFSDRSHRTKYNGALSGILHINAGVVQGSALGPPTL